MIQTSQKKKERKPIPAHVSYKVMKAFIEGRSFKEISESFDDIKYRSTAQWIVRKCQGKINESINVITEALQKDVLAQKQIHALMGALMGALLRKGISEMEELFDTEEIDQETPFFDAEVEDLDEFFERIRKYFEKMFLEG